MSNEEWKDGLPGVGVVCDIDFGIHIERGVVITYQGKGVGCYKDKRGREYTVVHASVSFRPIKKREPQPGEVWVHTMTSDTTNKVWVAGPKGFTRLSDGEFDLYHECHALIYAAPSVEAYIARKILDEIGSKVRPIVIDDYEFELNKAAGLDEE